jgi:hypothetical protein
MGGNEFAWILVQDLFDGGGSFCGTHTVRVKVTLIGKDEFVGVSTGETRDAAMQKGIQATRKERIVQRCGKTPTFRF